VFVLGNCLTVIAERGSNVRRLADWKNSAKDGRVGIDYVVNLDCAPKKALTTQKIIALVKAKNQAETVIELLRRDGDQRPVEQLTFTHVVHRPEGPTEQEVSVGALLKQTKELDAHAHHCQACEANLFEQPYGCYGSISYPISAEAEKWLMSLLPKELKTAAGHMLRSAVTDFGYTGGMFLEMRPQEMFFESQTPVKRKWGSWLSGWTLTSDQLLEMLFGLGDLQPAHCKMMCLILGMLQIDEDAEPLPPPPEEAEQVAHALNAMARAAQLEVELLVDA
jgi:hypothetical protein